MGQSKIAGLTKRGGIWHVDKQIRGTRVCESTGTGDVTQAKEYLAKRINDVREAKLYGVREEHTFRAAAIKYLDENQHKRSIADDASNLKLVNPFIGGLTLTKVNMATLGEFIAKRRHDGVKTKTLNSSLEIVRRILNLASSEWTDVNGQTWLEAAPKIKLFPVHDARQPYPLSSEEQALLFQELPRHLAEMALFKVNTGCREQEVCGLQWEFEVKVPELKTSVFIIPGSRVKNGEERIVVLNRIARSVVDSRRGKHSTHVFAFSPGEDSPPKPLTKIYNTAWKSARERAADKWKEAKGQEALVGFKRVRVHDLKHTFGRRLRAAGVSFEDRQDLLGHKSGRITTHYSQAELRNLIEASEKVCSEDSRNSPATSWLRRGAA